MTGTQTGCKETRSRARDLHGYYRSGITDLGLPQGETLYNTLHTNRSIPKMGRPLY